MTWDFDQIRSTAEKELAEVRDSKALEELRIKYLGRKGLIPEIFSGLGALPAQEKPVVGKGANQLRNVLTQWIEKKQGQLAAAEKKQSRGPAVDVSLPGVSRPRGTVHILNQIIAEICDIFAGLGFVVQDGPEIETEFHNFTALNVPADHPSRDAFDTFYLQAPDPDNRGRHLLLRSHTSPGQIRIMKENKPPFAVVIPGKVYRPDAVDATHSFMFHQIEGLLVADDVKFSDLKGLISVFCRKFFGDDIEMRFRPHFFPFTEPSAEVDISSRALPGKKDWLEIMGCGLVHPRVFEFSGYPKGRCTGLAFGMGIERMAMLRHNINDIRLFYENDLRFLTQFSQGAES